MDNSETVSTAPNTPAGTWFNRLALTVWFLCLLALLPVTDYWNTALFFLVVSVVPGFLLVVFILTVFVWNIVRALLSLRRGARRKTWRHIAIVLAGLAALPVGGYLGDFVALALLSGRLKAATELADPGAAPQPIQASSTAAIYVVDSFFFTIEGVAYDKSGRLGELLMKEPETRPPEWQAAMPVILQSRGYPRHLWGNYWKVTMSMD